MRGSGVPEDAEGWLRTIGSSTTEPLEEERRDAFEATEADLRDGPDAVETGCRVRTSEPNRFTSTLRSVRFPTFKTRGFSSFWAVDDQSKSRFTDAERSIDLRKTCAKNWL